MRYDTENAVIFVEVVISDHCIRTTFVEPAGSGEGIEQPVPTAPVLIEAGLALWTSEVKYVARVCDPLEATNRSCAPAVPRSTVMKPRVRAEMMMPDTMMAIRSSIRVKPSSPFPAW